MTDPTRAPQFAMPVYIAGPPLVEGQSPYQMVDADTTEQLGAGGKIGDSLVGFNIIPQTLSPGPVSIQDGDDAPVELFVGGANSVAVLVGWFVPVGAASQVGAWSIITGDNVKVFAMGAFTK